MLRKDDILLTQPALWSKLKVYGKTIKYVQLLTPNLSSSTSVVPSTSGFGSYITILEPSLVGHKVYVKITADDNRISLGWYKNENGIMGYDLITGNELTSSSTPSATEGVYEITQDMVHSGTNYLQLYWFVYSGLPTGSHTITVQLVDLTELGMDNIINPVLFNATDLGKYMQNNTLNRGSGLISIESPLSCYKNRQLPFAYQEVEYIESTGTQYIDTGLVANTNITYNFSFQVQNNSKAKLFGSRIDSVDSALAVYFNNSGLFTLNYGNSYEEPQGTFTATKIIVKSFIDDNRYKIYVNNELDLNFPLSQSFYSGNMYFGSYNNNGSPAVSSQSEQLKLYYCKIYDNNILVRNMIPCYRKADGVIGMYDTVNGVFYTNKGTGTFLKGKDVNVRTLDMLKSVDLGTLEYVYQSSTQYFQITVASTPADFKGTRKAICSIYKILQEQTPTADMPNMSIEIRNNAQVFIKNTSYTDITDFKNAMNGVILYYEPAENVKLNGLYKASSLLGKQNVKTNINEMYNNIYIYCLRNGSFINETSSSTQVSTFNIISDHKYFGLIEYENDIIDFTNNERVNMRAFDGTSSITGYIIPSSNYRKNGKIDCGVFTFGVSQTNANVNFRYVANGTGVVAKVKNALVIDLTALGLDNLTAQQFYDNYHDKFDMLANGQSVCLLSDTYTNYNGKYNKVLAEVDLGTLNWITANEYGETNCDNLAGIIKPISAPSIVFNAMCSKYESVSADNMYHSTTKDKMICQWQSAVSTGGRITISDDSFIGKTGAEIKTLLNGVKLIYELTTPTTETLSSKMIPSGITEIIDKNGIGLDFSN